MKIVHIESGLGNQMLSYCEYLALKSLHPDEDIYIETMIYDIPECNEVINQWNGYELKRIFGIDAPNIKERFTEEEWQKIMEEVHASEFWDKNWNYPVYITYALCNAGLDIRNIRGDFELKVATRNLNMKVEYKPTLKERLIDSPLGDLFKRTYRTVRKQHFITCDCHYQDVFYEGDDSVFTGQWLSLKRIGSGMERIEKEVREVFTFPEFKDFQNKEMAAFLDGCNAVAIHARRGDMLGCNGYCYKFGYFKRAISHIKKKVENPVFVFFCDSGSVEWCKQNAQIFNLDFVKDKIYFVDWNKGEESFRDMQLMAHCKHAVITNSSFGWWGAFFIQNPNKITISPKQEISTNTTYHC
ncbi:alpha-1,2-fucosyltransferase [Segatella copri]|uniref:alpha-1,2-fucosyltransferase n=1 Tax=Segatella copri TaxID=165179 RepID=UPI0020B87A20|nr:alpha-1,2-fucosyltransferase [Segatella copri]